MNKKLMPSDLERRREDYMLITGHAHYVDDLRAERGCPAILQMVVVRSPYAHAEVQAIELEAARTLPGVVAALAAPELNALASKKVCEQTCLTRNDRYSAQVLRWLIGAHSTT
jgi:CO/xanthine dehydrogenase Mo-binding subunit